MIIIIIYFTNKLIRRLGVIFFILFLFWQSKENMAKKINSKVRLIKIKKKRYIHLSISTDGNV